MLEDGNYGDPAGILPAGLAARNTLRLEAAMSLYGHELGDDITPYEAGLGWITKLQKGEFNGSAALEKQRSEGIGRKIAGFEMTEPGIARDGCDIYVDGEKVGVVTSGSPAPYLKKNIGLAFLPPHFANVGQEIKIDVRGKHLTAQVVPTPFYKRQK
jgi:aminomethyltransferase